MQGHPNRILLRFTKGYIHSLKENDLDHLLESEKLQLSAGDIPYYFTFHEETLNTYFSSKGVVSEEKTRSPNTVKIFTDATKSIEELSSPSGSPTHSSRLLRFTLRMLIPNFIKAQ